MTRPRWMRKVSSRSSSWHFLLAVSATGKGDSPLSRRKVTHWCQPTLYVAMVPLARALKIVWSFNSSKVLPSSPSFRGTAALAPARLAASISSQTW